MSYNFSTALSESLPNASFYQTSLTRTKYTENGGTYAYVEKYGSSSSSPNKTSVVDFALEIFNFTDDKISIQEQEIKGLNNVTKFAVPAYPGSLGTITQIGPVGTPASQLPSTSDSSLTVEFGNKKLECKPAGKTLVCAATIDEPFVIDRKAIYRNLTLYTLGAVAFGVAAYCVGKIIRKNTKTMYESGKTLLDCHKVVAVETVKELKKFATESPVQQDGSGSSLLPVLTGIWEKRNELKTSKGEPVGKAHYRAAVDLTKAGAKIAAVSTLTVVAAVTAYFGF